MVFRTTRTSKEEKKAIKQKFQDDLAAAIAAKPDLAVFVFFTKTKTKVDLPPGEERALKEIVTKKHITVAEIVDRERMRILLDSARGLAFRFQYLDIPLSPAEQATFFNEFGAELQTLVSKRFAQVDQTLARLEFLQDCTRKFKLHAEGFSL